MENRRKIIMDCDPGIDDAIALCLAAAHPEAFELLAITTVTGNQSIEKVTTNARDLAEFYGLDVPVAKGSPVPLLRSPLPAADVHGKNGLGEVELPQAKKELASENAVAFMRDLIMNLPEGEKVTLVPTGPLTNIALLFRVFPEVKERIEEVVLMGGSASYGNVTPTAEFNIYEDPEAAQIVYNEGVPTVMCGLDVTRKCGLTRNQIAKLAQSKGEVSRRIGDMLGFYLEGKSYKHAPMCAIHDAVTFMYLLHPELFKGERMPVTVECSGGVNRGMTICDRRWWLYDKEDCPVCVLLDADELKFQEYMIEAIYEMDERLKS